MKRTDIAMIILVASLSAFMAYFIVSAMPFLKPPEEAVEVETIDKIDPEVAEPDETVFNEDAINPTVKVTIGEG